MITFYSPVPEGQWEDLPWKTGVSSRPNGSHPHVSPTWVSFLRAPFWSMVLKQNHKEERKTLNFVFRSPKKDIPQMKRPTVSPDPSARFLSPRRAPQADLVGSVQLDVLDAQNHRPDESVCQPIRGGGGGAMHT